MQTGTGLRPKAVLAAGLSLAVCSPAAWATNGYFSHGYSTAQRALGGAGTALPEDGLIGSINPAGTVWVGDRTELSLSMFTPIRDFSASERGEGASNGIVTLSPVQELRSHNEYYPIPALGYTRRWGQKSNWGVALYGNGGLNTEYLGSTATFGQGLTGFEAECEGALGGGQPLGEDNAGFCGGNGRRAGVDMMVLFLTPSVSTKLGERSSVGFAPVLSMARFAAQGLGAFRQFSNAPDKVSNNGHELTFGAGYRVGLLTGLLPGINLGASYQSRIWMEPFEDYAGLFAGQGDFDIPETWNAGLALRLGERQRLLVDYQFIAYSQIASVGNPLDPNVFVNQCAIPRLFAGMGFGEAEQSPACLGASTGPGFGWQDMEIWKVGYQYRLAGTTFRLGYSQTKQPIPSTEVLFNTLAPGVIEKHYTAGLSFRWSESLIIETSLMYGQGKDVRGKNPLSNTEANLISLLGAGSGLDPITGLISPETANAFGPDENDQDLTLRMDQYEITLGLSWRY